MADTLTNTSIEAEDYKDVYLLASVAGGTGIIIQNIGVTDLYFTISEDKPLKDNDAYLIFRRGEFITVDQGDPSIWVFSPQENGLINVEIIPRDILLELLNTNFILLNSQLASIILQHKLLNERIEEMGETGITKEDV